jgi:hypothetical protein
MIQSPVSCEEASMTATSVRYNVAVLDMDTRNPEGGT